MRGQTKGAMFKWEVFALNISTTQDNGKLNIALEGRLDTTTAPQLEAVLVPAFDETGDITLDFTKLGYVSSAGLRVLLTGHKTAKAKGALMAVANVPDDIMEVLEMTGFSDMLTIV